MKHKMSHVEAEKHVQILLSQFDPRMMMRAYEKDLYKKYSFGATGFKFTSRNLKTIFEYENIHVAIEDCSQLHKELKVKNKIEGMLTMHDVDGDTPVAKIIVSDKLDDKYRLRLLRYFFACYIYVSENPRLVDERGFFYSLITKKDDVVAMDENLRKFAQYFSLESTYFWSPV